MSKFDYGTFCGDYKEIVLSKEKYKKEQVIEIARQLCIDTTYEYLALGSAFVRHRASRDEGGESCVVWFLGYNEYKRSCPCWIFHLTNNPNESCRKNYEYIKLR